MPDHEKPDPDRPDTNEAYHRIFDLLDDDAVLHGIAECGSDDTYWYYLVVFTNEYEGREYLKERYVQLVQPHAAEAEGREDTFKKNGINRRVEGEPAEFARSVMQLYDQAVLNEEAIRDGADPDSVNPTYKQVGDS